MKKKLLVTFILLFPVLVCLLAWYYWYSPVTTVYLVRHAERLNATDTTSLSGAGIERARDLAHVLWVAGVKHIYVSQKQRTAQTAEPTARILSMVPVQIPASDFDAYADSIHAHSGEAALVVGHSDTVPLIIAKLGVSSPPAIPSTEYDNLFVVTIFRFRSTLVQLKFGKPSLPW